MKKYFPNTEAYLICFDGGACGNFIATLCCNFVLGERLKKVFNSGHAHNELSNNNFTEKSFNLWTDSDLYARVPGYEILEPLDKEKPIFIIDHAKPNFQKFFGIYPLGKIIIIISDEDAKLVIKGFLFFKLIQDLFKTNKKTVAGIKLQKKFEKLFNNIKKDNSNPINFSYNEIIEYINSIEFMEPIFKDFSIPNEYKNMVFKIHFKEILQSKNKTLSQISFITNKPIRTDIEEFYDQYLVKQKEIINCKMPWANNFLNIEHI